MEIFSTLRAGDVLADSSSKRGLIAFKAFLHYAETKILDVAEGSGRAPANDFEISIINALNHYGYECEPQVGTAGYFIDIGVRHPVRRGEFMMGIECDGASYHTGKSVRDRDRLRQEVLEQKGWTIRRIWSTDWFFDPKGTLVPVLRELEGLSKR